MNLLLAGAATVDAVTALSFLMVGAAVRRRQVSGTDRQAIVGFVAWWWAMATYLSLHAVLAFAALAGWVSLFATIGVRLATGPLLALAIWGLTNYMLYLYSGWRGWSWLLGAYFVAIAFLYDLMTVVGEPVGVDVGPYQVSLVHVTQPAGAVFALVLASFGLPVLAASLAYLGLLRHVADPAQRYRIVLVSMSLIVWVLAGYLGQLSASAWFRFASITVLGLFAAGVVFLAYYPPAPVRRRWSLPAAAQP